jgi:hypothetical protein
VAASSPPSIGLGPRRNANDNAVRAARAASSEPRSTACTRPSHDRARRRRLTELLDEHRLEARAAREDDGPWPVDGRLRIDRARLFARARAIEAQLRARHEAAELRVVALHGAERLGGRGGADLAERVGEHALELDRRRLRPRLEQGPLRHLHADAHLAERARRVARCPALSPRELLDEPAHRLFVLGRRDDRADRAHELRPHRRARPLGLSAHGGDQCGPYAHERLLGRARELLVFFSEERHDPRHVPDAGREPGLAHARCDIDGGFTRSHPCSRRP